MENETIFAQGFFWKRPKEGAQPFVKGHMGIKVEEAVAFLQEHKKEDGFVNVDLLLAKDGQRLYFKLDNFKPTPKNDPTDI